MPGKKSELEKLIEQQKADDTHKVSPRRATLSLDAPISYEGGTLSELVGRDMDGSTVTFWREPASFSPKRRKRRAGVPIPHGTLDGYNNHGCTCWLCRLAISGYRRIERWADSRKHVAPEVIAALHTARDECLRMWAVDPTKWTPHPGAFVPKRYYLSIPSPYWPGPDRRWKEFVPPPWTSFWMWVTFEKIKRKAPAPQQRPEA